VKCIIGGKWVTVKAQSFVVAAAAVLQALSLAIAVLMAFFYFAPDKIVFGVKTSAVIGAALTLHSFLGPNLSRFFSLGDRYLRLMVLATWRVLAVSLALFALAICWVALMFGNIVERYRYLDAIDTAISVIGTNQLALPAPEDLATAFSLMPQRPEVPFILMRAARLLTFDDHPENYYAYVQKFMSQIDKDAIAERFKLYQRRTKLTLDSGTSDLPLLDPIQIMTNFAIESGHPAAGRDWAIDVLRKYRDRDEDTEMKLWRSILEVDRLLDSSNDPEEKDRIRLKGIDTIQTQIEPQADGENFRKLSFAVDHVYQESLDYLAWLYVGGIDPKADLSAQCANPKMEKIVPLFQRIMLVRSRLLTRTDLLWWRSPTKLNVYFLYLHLGGQTGRVSSSVLSEFGRCPELMAKIQSLYSSIAFKQFQDPETWLYGTPLSPSFNGSASVVLLRQWVRMGW
jgi:hypothetical protein